MQCSIFIHFSYYSYIYTRRLIQRSNVWTDSELPLARTILDSFWTDWHIATQRFAREPCSNYISVCTMKRLNCIVLTSRVYMANWWDVWGNSCLSLKVTINLSSVLQISSNLKLNIYFGIVARLQQPYQDSKRKFQLSRFYKTSSDRVFSTIAKIWIKIHLDTWYVAIRCLQCRFSHGTKEAAAPHPA